MNRYRRKKPEEYFIIEWTGENFQELCRIVNASFASVPKGLFMSNTTADGSLEGIIPKKWFIVMNSDYNVVDVVADLEDFKLVLNGY